MPRCNFPQFALLAQIDHFPHLHTLESYAKNRNNSIKASTQSEFAQHVCENRQIATGDERFEISDGRTIVFGSNDGEVDVGCLAELLDACSSKRR